jgi:hypothetical protein
MAWKTGTSETRFHRFSAAPKHTSGSGRADHGEMKPFDAADFRAREVRERVSEPDDSESDEPDTDAE